MSNYRDKFFNNNESNYGWYTCVRCGRKLRKDDVDVDHIIPQHYGGGDSLNNLQCMCKHCNRSKGKDLNNSLGDYTKNTAKNIKNKVNEWFK